MLVILNPMSKISTLDQMGADHDAVVFEGGLVHELLNWHVPQLQARLAHNGHNLAPTDRRQRVAHVRGERGNDYYQGEEDTGAEHLLEYILSLYTFWYMKPTNTSKCK